MQDVPLSSNDTTQDVPLKCNDTVQGVPFLCNGLVCLGAYTPYQALNAYFSPAKGSCIEWVNRHSWPNENSNCFLGLTVIGKASLNLSCLLAVTHSRPYAVITGQSALYELDRAEKTAVLLPEPERTWHGGGEGDTTLSPMSPATDINSNLFTESSSD